MINTCQYCKLNQFIWFCGVRQEKATASNDILPALYDVMITANIRVEKRDVLHCKDHINFESRQQYWAIF